MTGTGPRERAPAARAGPAGLTLPAWMACVVVVTGATTRVALVALDPLGVVLVLLVVLVAALVDLRRLLRA